MLLTTCVTVFADIPTQILPSNTTIPTSAGAFSVGFSDLVDESVFDTISLTTEGETIKGGFYPEIGEDRRSVVIKYGALENGKQYTLTVAGVSKIYTAKGYKLDDDFEGTDYVVNNPPPRNKGIKWEDQSTVNYETSGNILVKQDDPNGSKYVRLEQSDNIQQEVYSIIDFEPGVLDEVVVFEVKFRPNNAEGVSPWGRLIFNTQFTGYTWRTQSLITIAPSNRFSVQPGIADVEVSGGMQINNGLSTDGVDANGFYHLEVVYKRGADNKYQIVMRNKLKPEDGDLIIKCTKPATDIDDIWLAAITTWGTTGDGDTWMDIDDLKITSASLPNILYTNVDKLDRSTDEFDVVFTSDMDENSVDAMTLKDAKGNLIKTTFKEYCEENRRATYTLNEYLKSGAEYTLDMTGVADNLGLTLKSSSYTFNAKETDGGVIISESVKNGSDVTLVDNKLNGATSVKLAVDAVNSSGNTSDFMLVAIIYDATGRIVNMETHIDKNVADGMTADLDLTTVTPLGEDYSVKRIVLRLDPENGAVSIAPTMLLK